MIKSILVQTLRWQSSPRTTAHTWLHHHHYSGQVATLRSPRHGQRDSLGVLLKPNLSRLKIMTVRIPHITSSSHTHTLWEEELGFLALLFQGNPPQVYLLMHKRLIFIYCAYWYLCAYLNYFIFIYLLAFFLRIYCINGVLFTSFVSSSKLYILFSLF